MTIKVFYLHGFASNFDPNSEKAQALAALGPVAGVDIDYTRDPADLLRLAGDAAAEAAPDVLVGTSMGGWLSSHLGTALRLPFVAVNPALNPADSLRKYIGEFVDYTGVKRVAEEGLIARFEPFKLGGRGLVLLDEGDEVIDHRRTVETLSGHFPIKVFPGGNHRFTHMEEALADIRDFYYSG